jgi:ABC-type branched-subunit amino acid transport system substrate-binding protein
MCADVINKEGGILGRKIDLQSKDEAGGVDAQVKLCRKLVLEDKVDVVLGYISSASCLAILPLSDELGCLIVAYDCGTHELMEGAKSPYDVPKFKLGFRSKAHLGIDNIALAMYIKKYYPNIKKIAGINQDYAWGRDSWLIFETAMKKLMPQVQVVKTLWPPLGNTDFTAHISALMGSEPDVVHSSLWGGDAVTFSKQAMGMGLRKSEWRIARSPIRKKWERITQMGRLSAALERITFYLRQKTKHLQTSRNGLWENIIRDMGNTQAIHATMPIRQFMPISTRWRRHPKQSVGGRPLRKLQKP